jgi:Leucine-rich repeat (LRR) protein
LHAGAHRFRFHPNLVAAADLQGINKLRRELRALDLSCNQLDCSSLQHLSQLVLLTSLNLAENSLGSEDSAADAAGGTPAADAAASRVGGAAAAAAAAAAVDAAAAQTMIPISGSAAVFVAVSTEQAASNSQSSGNGSVERAAQHQQQQQQRPLPSGLQHLAHMQQLQRLDLSSCGLQDVTPLVQLAGELAHCD